MDVLVTINDEYFDPELDFWIDVQDNGKYEVNSMPTLNWSCRHE